MKLFQIDAFTSEAFRGNPAAVCLLAERHLDRRREPAQRIAVVEKGKKERGLGEVHLRGNVLHPRCVTLAIGELV